MANGSSGVWTFLFVVGNVLFLAMTLLTGWNLTQFKFQNTFYLPADAPGVRSSNVGLDAFWWFLQISFGLRVLFLTAAVQRASRPSDRTYYIIQLVVLALALIGDILFFIWHFFEISDCNTPGAGAYRLNLCSDDRWCCVYGAEAPAAPDGVCPYRLSACDPAVTADTLDWNGRFLWSFALTITALILYVIHLVVTLSIGSGVQAMRQPQCVQDTACDRKVVVERSDINELADEDVEFLAEQIGVPYRAMGRPDPSEVQPGRTMPVGWA